MDAVLSSLKADAIVRRQQCGRLTTICLVLVSTATALQAQTVLHVDKNVTGGTGDGSSWQNAFSELSDALVSGVTIGGEIDIWVAKGTYTPDPQGLEDPRNATFQLIDNVALYGGFEGEDSTQYPGGETSREQRDPEANETILSGDLNSDDVGGLDDPSRDDNVFRVLDASNWDNNQVIDGFTVVGGNGSSGVSLGVAGGSAAGSIVVRNCVFTRNVAYGGGGLDISDSSDEGGVRVENCDFVDNQAGVMGGGVNAYGYAGPLLIGCRFIRNQAGESGGGLMSENALTLIGCSFLGNHTQASQGFGGGAAIDSLWSSENLAMINCVFSGNRAGRGGGIGIVGDYTVRLTNCSIVGNHANAGGGIRHDTDSNGYLFLNNSVLWFNTDGGPTDSGAQLSSSSERIFINYSCVQGLSLIPGSGNLTSAPFFVRRPDAGFDGYWGTPDDDYGDLRLRFDSPGIDAGDNEAIPADVLTDVAGHPRYLDVAGAVDIGNGTPPLADMGAYETGDCDNNGISDELENDTDNDGLIDPCDNCPLTTNDSQRDLDGDGLGDVCDGDDDADGIGDSQDNCPSVPNATQENTDNDDRGDACDRCAEDPDKQEPGQCGCGRPDDDPDADGVAECLDICPETPIGVQANRLGCAADHTAISFDDFSVADDLSLVGSAQRVDGRVRLTTINMWPYHGASWFAEPVPLLAGFETTFQFQITQPGGMFNGGDGFAFVIQNDGPETLSTEFGGSGLGYHGILNSLAVEFDMFYDYDFGPSEPHISVQTSGTDPNTVFLEDSLGYTTDIPDLQDGQVHTGTIVYQPGALRVYINEQLCLTVLLDLTETLDLSNGCPWVGFTAAMGAAQENHDILRWSLAVPDTPDPYADSDGDGFIDGCDVCPHTLPGLETDETGCSPPVPGDLDRDGDVDQTDFGIFQQCLTGPGVVQTDPHCAEAILDGDVDVDHDDFGIFQACISGPNIPADPDCAN